MSYTKTPAINRGRLPNVERVGMLPPDFLPATFTRRFAGLSVHEFGEGPIRQTVFRLDGVVIGADATGTLAFDTDTVSAALPLYALPRGRIVVLGGYANFKNGTYTATGQSTGITPFTNTPGFTGGQVANGLATGAALIWSVGVSATAPFVPARATLAGTGENELVASTAATFTAFTNSSTAAAVNAITVLDGTNNSGSQYYWNLCVMGPAVSATTETVTATGEIAVTWINLGNN